MNAPRAPRTSLPAKHPTRVRALCLTALAVGAAALVLLGQDTLPSRAADGDRPPLPRLEGPLLSGEGRASTDMLRGQRGIVFLFASDDPFAEESAALIQSLRAEATRANIGLLGVARDTDRDAARRFVAARGIAFPIVADEAFAISKALQLRLGASVVLMLDHERRLLGGTVLGGGTGGFDRAAYEALIRSTLRLPTNTSVAGPTLGVAPRAPAFDVTRASDGESLSLASLAGRPVVVVFFLHSCPHCHRALRVLGDLRQVLSGRGFAVVAVSVVNQRDAVMQMVDELELDYPVYLDPGGNAGRVYSESQSVPQMFVLDRDHRVIAYFEGMDDRIEALLSMAIPNVAGAETPMLLQKDAYSGSAACQVCHTTQHQTWSLTAHAYAFDRLIEQGEDKNPECVGCHTVGFGEPGGYSLEKRPEHLQGVQCESCHGRGGPHRSPEVAAAGYEARCATCHTPTHSLRFDFAERLPLISHAANAQYTALSLDERRALLAARGARPRTLFEPAEYVGSERCQSCHPAEHARWQASPHARALARIEGPAEPAKRDCLACHTTGFEQPGGFPSGGGPLENVGCESCHGPGSRHVAEGAPRTGNVLRLTEKCGSCVILKVCGACHDAENDPRFEFEVEEHIDRIRHGFRDRTPPPEPRS
jgi:peroxiredoxin